MPRVDQYVRECKREISNLEKNLLKEMKGLSYQSQIESIREKWDTIKEEGAVVDSAYSNNVNVGRSETDEDLPNDQCVRKGIERKEKGKGTE
jgi:hypothetical protein